MRIKENLPNCMEKHNIVILICSYAEWNALLKTMKVSNLQQSPYGDYFSNDQVESCRVTYFNTGCGKVNAGGGTQYVCDRWNPELIINLGTCGGFEGLANVGDILLANETVIYDIKEELGEVKETLEDYRTILNLAWINNKELISEYKKTVIVSADKDIVPGEIDELVKKYNAVAADWESGSIAHVAKINNTKCLILRGVSDIVGKNKTEIYGNRNLFEKRSNQIMQKLLKSNLVLSLDQIIGP